MSHLLVPLVPPLLPSSSAFVVKTGIVEHQWDSGTVGQWAVGQLGNQGLLLGKSGVV